MKQRKKRRRNSTRRSREKCSRNLMKCCCATSIYLHHRVSSSFFLVCWISEDRKIKWIYANDSPLENRNSKYIGERANTIIIIISICRDATRLHFSLLSINICRTIGRARRLRAIFISRLVRGSHSLWSRVLFRWEGKILCIFTLYTVCPRCHR